MKKNFCMLLFMIVLTGFSVISCKRSKNEGSTISYEQNTSPSNVVIQYFNYSTAGDESKLTMLITRTPLSYWVQCKPNANSSQKTIEDDSDKQTEKKWADDYFEFIKTTSKYIKINNVKLLSIYEERILGDEAVVSAQTGNQFNNQNMTFYLTRENEKWKIFLVNSDNSDPIKFKFAEERPVCN
jgi:hypothetical protein